MISIGVVGVGGMGKSHCNALGGVKDCQFTAVADVRADVAAEVAEKFGVKPFTDYNEMLDSVDAIIVATPPWYHGEVTVAAAKKAFTYSARSPFRPRWMTLTPWSPQPTKPT